MNFIFNAEFKHFPIGNLEPPWLNNSIIESSKDLAKFVILVKTKIQFLIWLRELLDSRLRGNDDRLIFETFVRGFIFSLCTQESKTDGRETRL
jgi:hypothetical protein